MAAARPVAMGDDTVALRALSQDRASCCRLTQRNTYHKHHSLLSPLAADDQRGLGRTLTDPSAWLRSGRRQARPFA
jgi:hypothetical protein